MFIPLWVSNAVGILLTHWLLSAVILSFWVFNLDCYPPGTDFYHLIVKRHSSSIASIFIFALLSFIIELLWLCLSPALKLHWSYFPLLNFMYVKSSYFFTWQKIIFSDRCSPSSFCYCSSSKSHFVLLCSCLFLFSSSSHLAMNSLIFQCS